LQAIGTYVLEAAAAAGLDKKRSYALRLAVDEVATNIITHGYEEAGLQGTVSIRADVDEQALVVTLEDNGAPFDPTTFRPPTDEELNRPLEERPMGGLGVYLAIQSADRFFYRRTRDTNRNVFIMNRAAHGNLLVADDDKTNRETLTRILLRQGYTVQCVEDGEAALAALAQGHYDLALVDVEAPKKDAVQVLELMRIDNALREIPVLVLAGQDQVESAEACIRAGAADYVTEPFNPVVLAARIAANLERQRVRLAEAALKESEKYEHDVQIGRQIQLSFLPDTLPETPDYEIAGRFEPAREVAGDFYDAFTLARNRVGLVLGDVCDKGVGAALFMALFRSLIRAFAQQHYSSGLLDSLTDTPAKQNSTQAPAGGQAAAAARRRNLPTTGTLALKNAMELTNNYIAINHGETSMFATIFFGVLDPDTGTLLYVNGGHEPPVIFSQAAAGNGAAPLVVRDRLHPTGPAVGIMPDAEFEIHQAQLEPGDTLLIYTDGVTEAMNPTHQLFTEERLLALLSTPDPSAAALLERIKESLCDHMAGAAQFDDITMLAVRRAPRTQ
jgi:sigma-B regulation protein RsbU (phosphoserine phosphatase)